MMVDKFTTAHEQNTEHLIHEWEQDFFIGRKEEIKRFQDLLNDSSSETRLIYFHGSGGIGKTYLLSELARIANNAHVPFLHLDSQDFLHTPKGFVDYLLQYLPTIFPSITPTTDYSLQACIKIINQLAMERQLIIAIDTYEKMDDLDRWLREIFIRKTNPAILFILAGRKKLTGAWVESPAWRRFVTQIELRDFNFTQTKDYLKHYGMQQSAEVKAAWHFSKGHPLTLSLAAMTINTGDENAKHSFTAPLPHVLMQLTNRWLQEVSNPVLHQVIEAAALLQFFNQEILSHCLQHDVERNIFSELVSLSFIRPCRYGWTMHDLIRDAIHIEFKKRQPDRFDQLNKQATRYYYERTIATRRIQDIAQLFYHLGDEVIQSVFYQDHIDQTMYMEPVGPHNFEEVLTYFENKKHLMEESNVQFYNREANQMYHFYASLDHNKRETDMINANYIKKMGFHTANLMKHADGKTAGLSIIVPINKRTLPFLMEEPVSRTYFNQLTAAERSIYQTEEQAGLFIRYLDYWDPTDSAARSFSLYNLFPLLLSGGRIIVSTPLPFFQSLVTSFGFQQIEAATHFDYGKDSPCHTYLLDVSGEKLAVYLQQFIGHTSIENQLDFLADTFSFTTRESEIVQLILENQSNLEIAEALFVAEITVKKHVGRILKKTNTRNRAELIKRLMELI